MTSVKYIGLDVHRNHRRCGSRREWQADHGVGGRDSRFHDT